MSAATSPRLTAPELFGYRKYWAHRLTPAPFLPMSREEMDELGWDQCDVILVTGDAYVDHPSFGMAIVGRVLESQGFRVGIIAQPDWRSTADFERLGEPALFFGITAGNMDSMVNRYTADRRVRRDDAYTPEGVGGKRPDRSVIVYSQRVREAFPEDADRDRRHRGEPAPNRALRLLAGEGPALDRARLARGPARVRQRRAADRRDRASARGRREAGRDQKRPRHGVRRQRGRRRLDRDRLDAPRFAGPHRQAPGPVRDGIGDRGGRARGGGERARRERRALHAPRADGRPRAQLHPPAELRAGARRPGALRARVADPAHGVEPRQRARARAAARRQRRLAQSAADPAHVARDGSHLRAAVSAATASRVRRREDTGLRDDPFLRHDPARLLRRLHVLLDHRARGPDHPEPQRGLDPARDRDDPRPRARLHGRDLRSRRPDREHVPARMQEPRDRVRVPAAVVRVSRRLPELEHGPRAVDQALSEGARAARHQEGA